VQVAAIGTETVFSVIAGGAANLTYQWYANTSFSNSGGTPIAGATAAEYTLVPDSSGIYYYYVEAISTDTSVSGAKTSLVKSIPIMVQVFDEIPYQYGYAGERVKYYYLKEKQELIFEGKGKILADWYLPWSYSNVKIGKGITGVEFRDVYAARYINYAAKFIVDEKNPILMSDANGILYDRKDKILLAFPGYSTLTEMNVLDGTVSILDSVFEACGKVEILRIPASLTDISLNMEGLSNLKEIHVENENPVFRVDDQGALINYAEGILLKYPSGKENIPETYIMDDSIVSVADGAFSRCSFQYIEFSEKLVSIGKNAFWNCYSLKDIVFPKSLRKIEDFAFIYCYSISDVYFLGDVPEEWGEKIFWQGDYYEPVRIHYDAGAKNWDSPVWTDDHGTEYPASPFDAELYLSGYACGDFAGWSYADGVLTVYGYGDMWDFSWDRLQGYQVHMQSITKVVVNYGITGIGMKAFESCQNLREVVFPKTLTTIGERAFLYTDIETLTLPASVSCIGDRAFVSCYSLNDVYFEGDVPEFWGEQELSEWGEYRVFDKSYNIGTPYYSGVIIHYPEGNTSGWTPETWTSPDNNVYVTETYVRGNNTFLGDINGDGNVNMADGDVFARFFAGWKDISICEANADIDEDGLVTRQDAMILARYLTGWKAYGMVLS